MVFYFLVEEYGSFHGINHTSMETSVEVMEASMELVEASTKVVEAFINFHEK